MSEPFPKGCPVCLKDNIAEMGAIVKGFNAWYCQDCELSFHIAKVSHNKAE